MMAVTGRRMTSIRVRWLPALLLATLLVGCAIRPGPEQFTPTAPKSGAQIVTVYVATTRARRTPDGNVFTDDFSRELNYAAFKIAIPPEHRAGQVEWPTLDPAAGFSTVQQEVIDKRAFQQLISARTGPRTPLKVTVFVHGFNTNFQEAVFRVAQMTADGDIAGVPVLFAWPSEAKVTGYVADEDAGVASRDQLAEVLTMLARDSAVADVTVIAHSMGAWPAVEALRQLRLAHKDAVISRLRIVLASPDIDVDVFRTQMAVIGPLSPPMTVLVARDDIALAVASFIAGERPRLGMIDVDDPRVQEAAVEAKLEIVDVSSVKAPDGMKHERFASLAALYPRLAAVDADGADLRRAGAFVFDAVGTPISSPFALAGSTISGR
jgi:esterase/lipase superfamily enzyme